jgi:Calcineurin-like phosphoesterase
LFFLAFSSYSITELFLPQCTSVILQLAIINSVKLEQAEDKDKLLIYANAIDYIGIKLDLIDKFKIAMDDIDILIDDLRQIIKTLNDLRKNIRDDLNRLIELGEKHTELDNSLMHIEEVLVKVRYAQDELYTASDMFDARKKREFRNCFSNFQMHLAQVSNALISIHVTMRQNQVILQKESYQLQQPEVSGSSTRPGILDQRSRQRALSAPISWLHLSDFHVGKDEYGQRQLFMHILSNIKDKVRAGRGPDIVFITGDIANEGQASEYKKFFEGFFFPLLDCLSEEARERIFLVPGNHDVDRSNAKAVKRHGVLRDVPEFLDPTKQGLAQRRPLLSRFQAYARSEIHQHTKVGSGWLFSQAGAYVSKIEIRGHSLGILGLNTAWLSSNEQDQDHLTPGKGILETGLAELSECNTRIVLGHHPIEWFIEEEIVPIRSLLGKSNAIYLHGHLRQPNFGQDGSAGFPFLTMPSGASFQERQIEKWANRILWCDWHPEEYFLKVEPLGWSEDFQEWRPDGKFFPERYRQKDRWELSLLPHIRGIFVDGQT